MSLAAPPPARTPATRLQSGADSAREFGFTRQDFERVRSLIHRRAGIALGDSKRDIVYSRLSRRLRQLGRSSFGEYLDWLEQADDPGEWQAFTNALTTNLTAFFREAHHFEILRQFLATRPPRERLTLWCAAASTGEEPYSLAMTVVEHYRSMTPPVRILATDIDTQVLEVAARGIYPLDRVEKLRQAQLRRFFRKGRGAHSGECRVVEELRALITFRPLNLLDPVWHLRGPFAAIFCRNVMIYFDKATQHRMIERMMPLLADDGLFVAGHSESLLHCSDLVRPVGRTVYRKAQRK
jgi:chemotaxis protein methyltransferase CheR